MFASGETSPAYKKVGERLSDKGCCICVVLLPYSLMCVAGYLPSDMVKCLAAFMDICYLLRRNSISADDLVTIKSTLDRFHHYRDIFIQTGVRVDISLPRQHSLVHYIRFIQLFGSPNGLCSSITESKHIKAVKEPWHRSSCYKALPQMLTTISRLEKMTASTVSFRARGMMVGTTSSYTAMVLAGDQPQMTAAALLDALAAYIQQPHFPALLRRFLHEEIHGPVDGDSHGVVLEDCPIFHARINVYHSVIARSYTPSDLCGAGGMYSERIRSNPNWHGYPRRDTVLIDVGAPAMGGLVVGRCALVRWFVPIGDSPDPDTGMWVVEPEVARRQPSLAIVNIDSMARAAHLIGLYGTAALPEHFHFSNTLDAFNRYFVNPYTDHHMYEFLK
ncbi:hypothetical protein B0H11DRAFT_2398839 [Mycena galericulata]|nr:hypothetical protein B0H11DRAFT_2398839 [Mycena galericulata]